MTDRPRPPVLKVYIPTSGSFLPIRRGRKAQAGRDSSNPLPARDTPRGERLADTDPFRRHWAGSPPTLWSARDPPSSTPTGAKARLGRIMSSSSTPSSSSSSSSSTATVTSGHPRPSPRHAGIDTFHNLFYISPVSTAPSHSSHRTSKFPTSAYSAYSAYSTSTTPTRAPMRYNVALRSNTHLSASPTASAGSSPVSTPRPRREKGKGAATILHNPDTELNRSSRASTFAADRRARADLCARLRTSWDAGAGMGAEADGKGSLSARAVENERVRGNIMWEMVHEGI
ncbi:hypothetical protein JCM24511_08840 [Saitozyma sp. JCM 24511]|nr:hypothetical protein JCM24511_08840 [Saitozyma sp. JCM 24511]